MAKQPIPLPVPVRPYRQVLIRPAGWHTDIPVACDEEGNVYWPVKAICVWLGVDPGGQSRKLRKSNKTASHMQYYLLTYPVGGEQPTWCIKEKRIGIWFTILDDPRVRDVIADKLEAFQDEMADVADEKLLNRSRLQLVMTNEQLTAAVRIQQHDIDTLKFAHTMLERRFGPVEESHFARQLNAPESTDDKEDEA